MLKLVTHLKISTKEHAINLTWDIGKEMRNLESTSKKSEKEEKMEDLAIVRNIILN
jgi:hypothetical protein